ncbi:hypothetical protein BJY54_005524 [Streptomyces nodosus]|nr:hypothetical protein [Streptomyces nodosus]
MTSAQSPLTVHNFAMHLRRGHPSGRQPNLAADLVAD